MKIENQVCSLEQAKKLKSFGVHQQALFCYIPKILKDDSVSETEATLYEYDDAFADVRGWLFEHYRLCAFNVAELGVMLPQEQDDEEEGPWFSIADEGFDADHKQDILGFSVKKLCNYQYGGPCEIVYPTEAQARAAMLIHLLENNLIKAEEVNQRLLNA